MQYLEVGIIAFIVTYILTPYLEKVGKKQNMVDIPNHRKVHEKAIPNLGGVAIFFGFLLSLLLGSQIDIQIKFLVAAGTIILLLGIVDDIVDLSPRNKFFIQMLPALMVIISNQALIKNFMEGPLKSWGLFSYLIYPVLIFWIVGVTNSINLIDGLDGLACGISILAFIVFFILGIVQGLAALNLVNLILASSMLAFLRFNIFPAQIFLGDSGSTFSGFMLASSSALWVLRSENLLYIFIPVMILFLPIFDTLWAIFRRFKNHQPIFQADKQHLHHRLLNRGISHKNVVLILWAVSAFFCLTALILVKM
ncbi:MAG: MraY family glycosyltransferase [Candidatus Caldatribacteriota bacterium]